MKQRRKALDDNRPRTILRKPRTKDRASWHPAAVSAFPEATYLEQTRARRVRVHCAAIHVFLTPRNEGLQNNTTRSVRGLRDLRPGWLARLRSAI